MSQAVALRMPLAPEDQARADVYALLGGLFSAPPDAALLRALGSVPHLPQSDESPWPAAFNRLIDASSVMDAEAAAQEYTDLFVGVGKSEIELYASYWMDAGAERPLAELRAVLAGLGIGRRDTSSHMEDHLGPLLETMRLLVAGDVDLPPSDVAPQRAFFDRWLGTWVDRCCAAIETCALANYYVRVAECTKIFLAIERDSFAID